MRVLLANKFFFLKGGAERVFFQERDFLLQNEIKVTDFAMDDPRNLPSPHASFFVSNTNFYNSKNICSRIKKAAKFVHSQEAIKKITELIKKGQPDIAHLHNIYHQLTPSIISVLKKHDVKLVLTLHDGKLICPSYLMLKKGEICMECGGRYFWKPVTKRCQGSLTQGLLLMLEAYWHKWIKSYEQVDLFLAPSCFLAQMIAQRIPPNKTRVLHNGVDIDQFNSNYQDEGYGLFFGRLSREKGIVTLLEAHQLIADSLTLKIAGAGPMEDELRKKYLYAEFLGYKESEELNDIIAKSAFVVVPSNWYENCSMVVLEAMAMSKPVIASNIGGIPEQVEDGKTGFLFEMGNVQKLADKMRVLAKNSKLRRNMGREGRKKVEKEYSLDAHCAKLMKIYEELLSKRP